MAELVENGAAVLSECGRFRYGLTRTWSDGPAALFIMLNPSTADAHTNDPTIRRCIAFAKRERCGSLRVENLYGLRAKDPNVMFRHEAAQGETDRFIREAALATDGPVIAAWGADRRAANRAAKVLRTLRAIGVTPVCLGTTKSGAPRHPLYLRADAPLSSLGDSPLAASSRRVNNAVTNRASQSGNISARN